MEDSQQNDLNFSEPDCSSFLQREFQDALEMRTPEEKIQQIVTKQSGEARQDQIQLIFEDPAEWPEVIPSTLSWERTDQNFPTNETGRKFQHNYYYRQLPKGGKVKKKFANRFSL